MKKSDLKKYLENPEKHIPDGFYCYNKDGKCVFWERKLGEFPSQEDGYCHYLGKSDWELNEERQHTFVIGGNQNEELNGKTVAEVFEEPTDDDIDPISGKVIHFGLSLLWDQCKECHINDKFEDEEQMVDWANTPTTHMEPTEPRK